MNRPDLSRGYDGWQILHPRAPNGVGGKAQGWAQDQSGLQELKGLLAKDLGAAYGPESVFIL